MRVYLSCDDGGVIPRYVLREAMPGSTKDLLTYNISRPLDTLKGLEQL